MTNPENRRAPSAPRLPTPRAKLVGAGSLALSLGGHALLVGLGAYLVSAFGPVASAPAPERPPELSVDLAPMTLPSIDATGERHERRPDDPPDPTALVFPQPVIAGGSEVPARPDMPESGRGGSPFAERAAQNLADRDEGLTLSPEEKSRIDRDQIQRLRTAKARASLEDRRASNEPMELVFLASGVGHLAERRERAAANPSQGALYAPTAAVLGTLAGAPGARADFASPNAEGAEAGGDRASPGAGILRGLPGSDHRSSAAVALGRPLVQKARPSVPADEMARPRDNVDSEQEVAAAVQSLVHASNAGGAVGPGLGGETGPGASGSGGVTGLGSRTVPFGGGRGPFTGLDEQDPRITAYQRSVRAKIYPLWENAFPKWAALEGRQGRAIVSFVIYADGRVDQVRVSRPSGIAEFDENVRSAVLRAAPFAPFPPSIPGKTMRWDLTFDMNNPVVR